MTIWALHEKEIEQQEFEEWCFLEDLEEVSPLDKEELNELVKHPPQLCQDKDLCNSRYLCELGCRCIRKRFRGAKQFNEYENIQKLYVKIRVLEIILGGIPYNKNRKIQSNQGKNLNNRFDGENNGY